MYIQRPQPRKRSVSLTPLIDVVFILLLFFMLASNFIEWRAIGLNVPAKGVAISSEQESLLIRVMRDGSLYLNDKAMKAEELNDQIQQALMRNAEQILGVQPEAGIPLQQIVTVLDRLTAAGGRNITLLHDR